MSRDLSASGTHAHALASRKEIVAWIQTKYQPSFRGIEELRTGAVFCQILDSVYPDAVALDKVKWDATQEKERLANFQIFQAGLERAQITKHVPVDALLKGTLPALLELVQWLKVVHDRRLIAGVPAYSAAARLERIGVKLKRAPEGGTRSGEGSSRPGHAQSIRRSRLRTPSPRSPRHGSGAKAADTSSAVASSSATPAPALSELEAERQLAELRAQAAKVERQHDFYFGKLRDIEMLCEQVTAEGDSSAVVQRVVELLRLGRDEAKPPSMAVPPLQQGFKPLQQDLNLQHDFSRASEGAESAASGGSVVPTLPLDEMRYHALESARLREKVATARQMIAEEEARRGKHAWLADGSLLLYCTATARDAWEELKEKILACTPLAAAPSPAPSVAPSRPGSSRLRSAVPPTAAASSARSRPRTAQPGSARTSALSSGRAPFTRVSTLGSGRTGVGSSARGPRAPSPVMGSARGRATIPMQ